MKAETLAAIVPSAGLARCRDLIAGYNWCARTVGATTVPRAAMLIAMVAEESASLHALEEYADGSEYNWRSDLGNTHPGDGPRFKGRTLIQITGRNNYGRTSRWAYDRKIAGVTSPTYFVDHPAALALPQYAWVGPAEYWLGGHNHGYGSINKAADARDIVAATYMVNGGLNGLEVRTAYWRRALSFGTAILPTAPEAAATHHRKELDMATLVVVDLAECKRKRVPWPGWFLDTGDMSPRHIATKTELNVRRKQGLRTTKLSIADARGIGIK